MITDDTPRGEQEFWRANTYQLLAKLLTNPPPLQLVAQLAAIPPPDRYNQEDAVAQAWCGLGEVARRIREPDLFKEYGLLFEANEGILTPRESCYVSQESAMDQLNILHSELAGLGIARNNTLPEDHAGSLCEIMCLLIESEDPRQIGFFSRHLKHWLPEFFRELKLAPSADFYRPVGSLGEAFIEVERIFLRDTY